MALLDWKESYRTGFASVDHEHKQLIALINGLYEQLQGSAEPAEVLAFLGEVHARIAAHFALEEQLMREVGYAEYEDHKADHETLLDDIRAIMEDYARGAYAGYDATLARHLRDWFGVHFATRDARFHRALG